MDNGQRTTDNDRRCIQCPTPGNLRCVGLDVRRFCELIDPSCPYYDPGYLEVIDRAARRAAEDADAQLASFQQQGLGESIKDVGGTIAILADCCGGGVPTGVYDEPGD